MGVHLKKFLQMIINNLSSNPEYFTGRILIEAVNLSRKTKDFLKEKSIQTLLQFYKMDSALIESAPNKNIQREIYDFQHNVRRLMKKDIKKVKYSHSIPPPYIFPSREEKAKLIALLVVEPLLGNRRNISIAKDLHVGRLYESNGFQKKDRIPGRSLRKTPIAA